LLIPVLVLATCAATGSIRTPAAAPADTLIDVGDHRLHLEVIEGSASFAFVLEAGGGADMTSWATVPEALAARTGATVVAYDRAGMGESELGPSDLTPRAEIENLRVALARLGVPSRRILVGTSYGALLALWHAALHPEEIAGVLLVDPMNPGFVEATGDFVWSTVPTIDHAETDRERALVRLMSSFEDLIGEVDRVEPEIERPIAVITAGKPWWGNEEADAAWRRSHEELAGGRSTRWLVVAEGSDHRVPARRPDVIVETAARLLDVVEGGGT